MSKNKNRIFSEFVDNFKKPIFILGMFSWVALFIIMSTESFSLVKTGYAISNTRIAGFSGAEIIVLIFVLLSILMFLVWRYVIKDLRNNKKSKKR